MYRTIIINCINTIKLNVSTPNATAWWEYGVGGRPQTSKSEERGALLSSNLSSAPERGPHPWRFSASRPCTAATWAGGLLALWALLTLITLAEDIESNPRPQTKYICPSCNKNITRSQESIRCNITPNTLDTHKMQRDKHQTMHRHMEMKHSQSTQQHITDKTPNCSEHKPITQCIPKSITNYKSTKQHHNEQPTAVNQQINE